MTRRGLTAHDDLDHGGYAKFWFLLNNLKLGNWHPWQIVSTDEAVEYSASAAIASRNGRRHASTRTRLSEPSSASAYH